MLVLLFVLVGAVFFILYHKRPILPKEILKDPKKIFQQHREVKIKDQYAGAVKDILSVNFFSPNENINFEKSLYIANSGIPVHNYEEIKFNDCSIYVNESDIMLHNINQQNYPNTLFALYNRRLIVLVLIQNKHQKPDNYTDSLYISIHKISNFFDKSIILFIDVSNILKGETPILISASDHVKILPNSIQIDWSQIDNRPLLTETNKENTKDDFPVENSNEKLKIIDYGECFGFQDKSNNILILKNKKKNNVLSKIISLIENLYT